MGFKTLANRWSSNRAVDNTIEPSTKASQLERPVSLGSTKSTSSSSVDEKVQVTQKDAYMKPRKALEIFDSLDMDSGDWSEDDDDEHVPVTVSGRMSLLRRDSAMSPLPSQGNATRGRRTARNAA